MTSSLLFLLQIQLPDGGPQYTETDLTQLIAEPWNGASAAVFMLIVAYWAIQLRGKLRTHRFMVVCLLLLAIGGIGGTLYHTFRISKMFMYMDWLPILLICLATSFYFFVELMGNWWQPALIVGSVTLSQILMFEREVLHHDTATNVNYLVMASLVLIPTALMLWKNRFYAWQWVAIALGAFGIAITCRILDYQALLPMGTHFLWHLFGALACFSMFQYVYDNKELALQKLALQPV